MVIYKKIISKALLY